MVDCIFCGKTIKLGQGKIYAKKDGTAYNLCSHKCEKNLIIMKRKPVRTKWTQAHHKLKAAATSSKTVKKEVKKEKSESK